LNFVSILDQFQPVSFGILKIDNSHGLSIVAGTVFGFGEKRDSSSREFLVFLNEVRYLEADMHATAIVTVETVCFR